MRAGRPEMTTAQRSDATLKKLSALPALLATAAGTAGANVFLECHNAWQTLFIQLSQNNATQVRLFADVAANISRLAPSSQAGLDLLLVAAGLQPAREHAAMDATTAAAYLNGLRARFTTLTPETVRRHSAELAKLLVPGRLTRSGADFLFDLAAVVRQTPSLDGQEIYRWIAKRATFEPEALYGQSLGMIRYLTGLEPSLGVILARRQLGDAAAGDWSLEDAVATCVQAYQCGMSTTAILDGLGAWRGLDNPANTFHLLDEIWKVAGRPNPELGDPVLDAGLGHVLEGRCGLERAQPMRDWLARRAELYRWHSSVLQKIIKGHKPTRQTRRQAGQASPERWGSPGNSGRSQ
jgi:hypothetical protein